MRLIQGVWERDPGQARRILRKRILATTRDPSEMCLGMVKVAAKRLDLGVSAEPCPGLETIECGPLEASGRVGGEDCPQTAIPAAGSDSALGDEAWMRLALELAERVEPGRERYLSDRRVAAILVSRDGELLGAALNTNARNRTRHAEVNLIQGFCRRVGGPLPEGARVYVTLKSCKMCAAMIWSAARAPCSLSVVYAQEDEGPMARLTVLTPGSHERQRAARQAEALAATERLLAARIERRF